MIPTTPTIRKAYTTTTVKSNHFPIKIHKAMDIYRFSLSARDGNVDNVEIKAMVFNLDH